MRWHVQGTDALTGQEVELAVDRDDSAQAVQAALERKIVVRQVVPGPRGGRPRFLVPLTVALVIALGAVSTGLYLQNRSLRGTLDQAVAEQDRLASSVAQAQQTAASISSSGALGQNAQPQIAALAAQLADARRRMSSTEQELTSAHQQVTTLQQYARQTSDLQVKLQVLNQQLQETRGQLQASQALAVQLRTELMMEERRIENVQSTDAQVAAAKIATLEKANTSLAGQVDALKAELLTLAARAPTIARAPAPADPPPLSAPAHVRWALTASYDDLRAFLVLHADGGDLAVHDEGDNLISSSALMSSHAVKLTLLHDRTRQRVYVATLTVSLAADAPPIILADNKALIADFLHVAAPTLKDAGPVVAATAELAGQDASRRMVFLADDARITLWNDKTGVYTVCVDCSRED